MRIGFRRIVLGAAVASAAVLPGATSCAFTHPAQAIVALPPVELGATAVQFASGSGSHIHAWFIPGRQGAGAVLLLHGVGANRSSMLARARMFHALGYTVLAPDFQAHGESPGAHITFGALESFDAGAALEFLRAHAKGERIGVIGVSMGGAAILLGPSPLHADAIVLESVYPTIRLAVSDRLEAWLGPLAFLAPPLVPVFLARFGASTGVNESQLRPIDHIGSVTAPILVVAGTRDQYTRLSEATALFARAPSPKEFWAVAGAGHVDLYDFTPREYERRVGGFLLRHLRVGGGQTALAPAPSE